MLSIKNILEKYHKKIDFLDLELIISRVIKKPREFILGHPEFTISTKHASQIANYANRRIKHEPLAYILGHKEFYGLDFKVNRNVLIPRPETELLVEETLNLLKTKKYQLKIVIIDVGTGSGNIIISIARNMIYSPNMNFFALDRSKKALKIAKINAKINLVCKKIKFMEGNLLKPLIKKTIKRMRNKKFFIIANLPYGWLAWNNNSSSETKGLKFEPSMALFTGKRGLELYEKLLLQLLQFKELSGNISALFEIDPRQHVAIRTLIKKIIPSAKIKFKKDLANNWRLCKIDIID